MILGTLSLLSRVADAKLDKTSLSTDAATGPRIHYIIPCSVITCSYFIVSGFVFAVEK